MSFEKICGRLNQISNDISGSRYSLYVIGDSTRLKLARCLHDRCLIFHLDVNNLFNLLRAHSPRNQLNAIALLQLNAVALLHLQAVKENLLYDTVEERRWHAVLGDYYEYRCKSSVFLMEDLPYHLLEAGYKQRSVNADNY